ncbi:hypothetical protein JCM14076_31750 [Methylosoma difficile]|jgi:hypothetical protein|nr:hypothetical protein [Methylovulum sp.]
MVAIKIIKSSNEKDWYSNKIGQIFKLSLKDNISFMVKNDSGQFLAVALDDAIIIDVPD